HLFNRDRLASLALKHPFQFLYRACGRDDGELPLSLLNKFHPISLRQPERFADTRGYRDLTFGSEGCDSHSGFNTPYIIVRNRDGVKEEGGLWKRADNRNRR